MADDAQGMDLSMRLRAPPSDPPTSRPSPPVQLDLLPLHPLSLHLHQGPASGDSHSHSSPSPSTTLLHRFCWPASSSAKAGSQDKEATETFSSGRGGGGMGMSIDVNQIPASTDCDDAVVSSPNSVNVKRERLKRSHQDMDMEADRDRAPPATTACDMSSRGSDEEEGGNTRKKLRLSKEQSALLEESFKEHSTLNPKQKAALAKQLNLRPRQVEVWFQNRRARTKLKQTEVDCELLKRYCENLSEENRRLQKELQELRAIKVPPPCVIAHDYYMPLPAATLTMCPSCERLATVDNRSSLAFSKPSYSHFPQSSAAC